MTAVLVIGYGNTLRGDDGAGPKVAELVADTVLPEQATVLVRPQLLPELAADLVDRSVVVFVDAAATPTPGSIAIRRIEAAAADASDGSGLTHHVSPQALLLLAERLFGARPNAFLVTLGAASFDLGEELSPPVTAALPEAAAAVRRLIDEACAG
ncbi:MAG: hydrogenase maturation protease [Ancalomicrobiaceae bacterium]|nr:hydrogenase maturation protease [Ancalomicrobiaceae bacterium]